MKISGVEYLNVYLCHVRNTKNVDQNIWANGHALYIFYSFHIICQKKIYLFRRVLDFRLMIVVNCDNFINAYYATRTFEFHIWF